MSRCSPNVSTYLGQSLMCFDRLDRIRVCFDNVRPKKFKICFDRPRPKKNCSNLLDSSKACFASAQPRKLCSTVRPKAYMFQTSGSHSAWYVSTVSTNLVVFLDLLDIEFISADFSVLKSTNFFSNQVSKSTKVSGLTAKLF